MTEYPIKEIVVQKIYTTHILIRANTNEEALNKVEKLAEQGNFEDCFTDEPYYEVEKYNAYKEGYINEDVIYQD